MPVVVTSLFENDFGELMDIISVATAVDSQ